MNETNIITPEKFYFSTMSQHPEHNLVFACIPKWQALLARLWEMDQLQRQSMPPECANYADEFNSLNYYSTVVDSDGA